MGQATNIVLADAQATPVNHTFIPLGPDPKDPTTFWWEDQSAANAIGYWRISIQMKRPMPGKAGDDSSQRVCRVVVGLHEPALENVTNSTVSGIAPAPTVSHVPRKFSEYVLPEKSNLLQRQNLRKMGYNLENNQHVIDAVETLVGPW